MEFLTRTLIHRKNNQKYAISCAALVAASDAQLHRIAKICNEPLVYKLHRERGGDKPYSLEDAKGFLDWARAGWENGTHFVFAILDDSGLIAATMDIKSTDRSCAEIGYWCGGDHAGLMSDAVTILLDFAARNGFRSLCARVRKDNIASQKVLERNGFAQTGDWDGDALRFRYERSLSADPKTVA